MCNTNLSENESHSKLVIGLLKWKQYLKSKTLKSLPNVVPNQKTQELNSDADFNWYAERGHESPDLRVLWIRRLLTNELLAVPFLKRVQI